MTRLNDLALSAYGRPLADLSNQQACSMLQDLVKERSAALAPTAGKRRLYYISAEFLLGKLLTNNLINLGLYEDVKAQLEDAGLSLSEVEECEVEPSLGNGGLGRLAACFLDSIATLGLPGDGIGLNYHFGLFRQKFVQNQQLALPDAWLGEEDVLVGGREAFQVPFADFTVTSKLYTIDVLGYGRKTKNRLRLFDLVGVDDTLVPHDSIEFDKREVRRNLTLFLYPDDSDEDGRLLRVYQQYFMVSNAAQLILAEAVERGSNLHDLADYAVVQINDTHPTMVIPELIRLLEEEHDMAFDEAVNIVSRMVAYTNHTILAEALEKWPLAFIERVSPQIAAIIRKLDARIAKNYDDPAVQIIQDGVVHMAHLAIHYGISVNGVAALHTKILEESELSSFYRIYPEKFNNKTNGISHRRFLGNSNPPYGKLITDTIGDGWLKDATQLSRLGQYEDDPSFQEEFAKARQWNKERLASYVKRTSGVELDCSMVFDVQVKRFHAYKRQLLNIMKVMDLRNRLLDDPSLEVRPTAFVFSGKAAQSYTFAKEVIRLINAVADVVNKDGRVNDRIRVAFVPNFAVSSAQLIYPAADISEQISWAGSEASGTSNMKLMMNGAITLGTYDGANVEIAKLVGEDSIKIFGLRTEEVDALRASGTWFAWDVYNKDHERLGRIIDQLNDGTFAELSGSFQSVHDELMMSNDHDLVLADFYSYVKAWEELVQTYGDRRSWIRASIHNTAQSGFFSSDRTVREYNSEIWHA